MSRVRKGDRVAAAEVVNLFREGKIVGYRISRRRTIWLVVETGRYSEFGVHASEAVLGHLKRADIPRYKGLWERQHTVNPMGLPDVQVLD